MSSLTLDDYEEVGFNYFKKNGIYVWFNQWSNEIMHVKIIDIQDETIIYYDISDKSKKEYTIDLSYWTENDLRAFRIQFHATKSPKPRQSRQVRDLIHKGGTKRRHKKARKTKFKRVSLRGELSS
jgi:hypothetical protein